MKSIKIRLELNNTQVTLARKHSGVARHAYNWGVAICQQAFESKEKIPSAIDLHKRLVAEVKSEHAWYYEVSKCAPQQALRNLQTAYTNFYRIQKESGYKKIKQVRRGGRMLAVLEGLPQFKKKGRRDSFYLDGSIRVSPCGKKLKLPHLSWVRLSESVDPATVITSVSISRIADHWFVSGTPDRFKVPFEPVVTTKPYGAVGVDLGIRTLATLSDGTVFEAVKPYKRYKRKLKLAQRKASKKHIKGQKQQSANYKKATRKVARVHAAAADRPDCQYPR